MFQINIPVLADRYGQCQHPSDPALDPAVLKPKLIAGETKQAILTTVYAPAGIRDTPLESNYNAVQIQDLLYVFHFLRIHLAL
jgi:hypothetical protein